MYPLLVFLFAQFRFEWNRPITLQIEPTPIERLTANRDLILIPNESDQVVHVLATDGKLKTNLGGVDQERKFAAPQQVTWLARLGQFYVYDTGKLEFTVWNPDGSFVEEKKTDYDLFFSVGELHPVKGGFVAPVTLTEGRFLLGKLDKSFKVIKNGYELVDPALAELPPEFRETHIARVVASGSILVLAIQKLAKQVVVFNNDLEYVRSLTLNTKGWKKVKMKRLEKVARNPKSLNRYRDFYSEISSLKGLSGSTFIVGIRNLASPKTYTYQCYDASNGIPVGLAFETDRKLVGAYRNILYFTDPNVEDMILFPCTVSK